jgi:hypothetical protein
MVGLGALCLFFFGVGIVALVWPERIQGWMLNFHETGSGMARWNPFLSWMRTSAYVTSLRVVGALSIGAGCFVLMTLVKGGT